MDSTILRPVMDQTARESTIVASIIKRLSREPGLWCVKFHGSAMTRAGVPDILGSYCGRMFALEVKRPGQKGHGVSPKQQYELQRLANAGARAAVVESVADALQVLGIKP